MSNKLLTIADITRESLRVLHEECQLLKACTRKYEDRFAKSGAKIGASVDIRKPVKYGVVESADVTGQIEDSVESFITLNVNKRRVIPMQFTSEELTLDIDDFSKRFIRPAMQRLARKIDQDIAEEIVANGYRLGRSDITTPVTFEDVTLLNAQLNTQFAETGDRRLFMDAFNQAKIVNENRQLFQSAKELGKQYETGSMGLAGGFNFISSETVPKINFTGTITAAVVNGAVVNGVTSIALDGITGTATSIAKGQAFTVPGVYQVDPETLEALPRLYTFIAAGDAVITAGAATVSVVTPIVAVEDANYGKSDINVSALPADDASATFLEGTASAGSIGQLGVALAPEAVTFASVDLELPGVSKMEYREAYDGVSMRIVKTYNGLTDEGLYRVELLYGVKTVRPEHVASTIGAL